MTAYAIRISDWSTDVCSSDLRIGLERFFVEVLGEKRFRAHQVMKWIYHRHVTDFGQMTDVGKALRDKLERHAQVLPPGIVFDKPSTDGTHKWLLGMDGGNAKIGRAHV